MMTYDVILRKKNNKYIARVRNWPELVIEEDSRDEALMQIKEQLAEYLSQPPEIVQIGLDSPPEHKDHPWLRFAGMWPMIQPGMIF